MAKSYSHSMGRDMMNLGPGPKLGPQGSRNLLSGPPKHLPSIFSLGSRAPPPLPPPPPHRDEPNQAKILASFGLSSRDLDELSRYPEEKITPESLPQLIQQIKRRRSEDMGMLSYRERLPREPLRPPSNDWDDDVRPYRRETFVDRPSGLDHVVDYDHGSRSREPPYRERLDLDDHMRDRERFRDDDYMSDNSFRKHGQDYEPMGYSQPQERSVFEKTRGMPSIRNVDDFHGLLPKDFPHLCSLCDIPVHTKKGWSEHVNGPTHRRHRLLLLDVYPEWNGHGMGDTLVLRQSTNHAPGILGPPPPAPKSLFSMGGGPGGPGGPGRPGGPGGPGRPGGHGGPGGPGGPDGRRGRQLRPHLEMEDHGPRRMPNRPQALGRVVHIINFERGRNLKNQLLRLAQPFGEITGHLILNKMNEAFIEMANADDAMAVVDYYSTNQAMVMGKPVHVHLSQKYKRIKKTEQKPEIKTEQKKAEGCRVIHLSKLPSVGYTDAALLKLVATFGRVKNYILMRVRNQAFVEMERVEDAEDMVKQCEIVPLLFHGKALKVDLSGRYKTLVLKFPNKFLEQKEKEKNRKRVHSPDRKEGVMEKQKKTEATEEGAGDGEGQAEESVADDTVHTSEETDQKDIVSDSCEPELLEEEEEDAEEVDEEEAAALLETNSSMADDEVLDPSEIEEKDGGDDQTEPDSSAFSEEKLKGESKYSGNIDDFVTLDEVGDDEDSDKVKAVEGKAEGSLMASSSMEEKEQENEAEAEEAEDKQDFKPAVKSESAQAKEGNGQANTIPELSKDYVLPAFQPNNPVGVDFVVPKTGFYCKLCSLFYTNEDVAKVTHCSTLPHYQKLKKLLNKMATNPGKKN